MIYITLKKPPKAVQFSFEDMLFGVNPEKFNLEIKDTHDTRTYVYESTPQNLLEKVDIINMIQILEDFCIRYAELILATATIVVMTGAFCSSWFYMVKKGIETSKGIYVLDADRAKAIGNLLKLMPRGIAKFFLPIICALMLFKVCSICLYLLINITGTALIGEIYTAEQASQIISLTPQEMISFLGTLSDEQITKLRLWNLLIISTTTIYLFSIMLWIPEIIYSTQNPIIALLKSIQKVYKKFWKSVALFLYLTILISSLSSFLSLRAKRRLSHSANGT